MHRLTGLVLSAAILSATSASVASAATTSTLAVDGVDNIWGAGHAAPPDSGTLPPFVSFPSAEQQVLSFDSVTGQVGCQGTPVNGPDGTCFPGTATALESYGGISGITDGDANMFLVGVFLGPYEPQDPPPPSLDFTGDTDFSLISPLIGQVFFIGDGRTSSGAIQQFNVPREAERLFLGFADGCSFQGPPACYDDNAGYLDATLSISSRVGPALPPPPVGVVIPPVQPGRIESPPTAPGGLVFTTDGYWERLENNYWKGAGAAGACTSLALVNPVYAPVATFCAPSAAILGATATAVWIGRGIGEFFSKSALRAAADRQVVRPVTPRTLRAAADRQVVRPVTPRIRSVRARGRLNRRAAQALTKVLRNEAASLGLLRAFLTSAERSHNAGLARDPTLEERQVQAAATYASRLAASVQRSVRLRSTAVRALRTSRFPNPLIRSAYARLKRRVARHGLPRSFTRYLSTKRERDRMRQTILRQQLSEIPRRLYSGLSNPASARELRRLAFDLNEYARHIRQTPGEAG